MQRVVFHEKIPAFLNTSYLLLKSFYTFNEQYLFIYYFYFFINIMWCSEAVTENSNKKGSFNRRKIPPNGNAVYTRRKANNSQKKSPRKTHLAHAKIVRVICTRSFKFKIISQRALVARHASSVHAFLTCGFKKRCQSVEYFFQKSDVLC